MDSPTYGGDECIGGVKVTILVNFSLREYTCHKWNSTWPGAPLQRRENSDMVVTVTLFYGWAPSTGLCWQALVRFTKLS